MTVKKRGKRWSVEVYDPAIASKKRYVGTFDTQQEARAAGRVAESEIAARRGRPAGTTVADFASRWLHMHPREKESTNIGYAQQIKPFVERFGEVALRAVTVEVAHMWTLEHRWTLGGVRAMFSDARKHDLVESNPFTNLRLRGSRGRRTSTFSRATKWSSSSRARSRSGRARSPT